MRWSARLLQRPHARYRERHGRSGACVGGRAAAAQLQVAPGIYRIHGILVRRVKHFTAVFIQREVWYIKWGAPGPGPCMEHVNRRAHDLIFSSLDHRVQLTAVPSSDEGAPPRRNFLPKGLAGAGVHVALRNLLSEASAD